MKVRTRLTLWFAGVLISALMAMGVVSYYELVAEPRRDARDRNTEGAEAEDEGAGDIVGILAWCGLPALALGLGGGWWLMRRALEPVLALTEAAERMDEHHVGRPLARTGTGDELDRLTEVFNRMTERVGQSFTRIREFTLHASHELKTPLTVMHGELESWLQEETLTTPQRERLESELDEVQRLTKIVDGLTLLTRADAGQIQLARDPVRLDEIVRETCVDGQSLGRPLDIAVTVGNCEELVVAGDRHRLRQLLLNLADNAIKYNDPKGSVKIELRRVGEVAELRITNGGPGISPENLPRVFDPFFRGHPSPTRDAEGCGLGLSIARWIVTVHGGIIRLESAPGELTVAVVNLPLAKS